MISKKLMRLILRGLLLFLSGFLLQDCSHQKTGNPRIVYVNSYHRGHPSSDEIMDAIAGEFQADSFELVTYIMDTKRNPSQDYIERKAAEIYDSIRAIVPDVVIVSDDDAVKYLIQNYFTETGIPVVFCGVNWSAKEYKLQSVRATGMLEILPLAEVLLAIKPLYPTAKRMLVLNENTTTSRKEKLILDTLFTRLEISVEHELVNDFENWKKHFQEGNNKFDLIYIPTHGAIKGWDKDEAEKFVFENILVPVVTCEDFMMPYAVLGITKVAKEQGIWAAKTAKAILKGKNPSEIPVTRNHESKIWLNSRLGEKINFQPDQELLSKAIILNGM